MSAALAQTRTETTEALALHIAGVAKAYGATVALRRVSFDLRRARCTRCWAKTAPASRRWSRSSAASWRRTSAR